MSGETHHLASLTAKPEVRVYHKERELGLEPLYYWCCVGDGACGTMLIDLGEAIHEGWAHIQHTHPQQEVHDGRYGHIAGTQ